MNSVIAVMTLLVAGFCGGMAQILFKLGISPFNIIRLGMGFGLYGIAFVLYLFALRYLSLSTAYFLIALSYVWVAIGSYYVLSEPWSVSKSLGVCGIILSVWLVAR